MKVDVNLRKWENIMEEKKDVKMELRIGFRKIEGF